MIELDDRGFTLGHGLFETVLWAGVDGALEASVLIRTVALAEIPGGWAFEARAGGGIVADSDPAREYEETLHKAAGLLRALNPT